MFFWYRCTTFWSISYLTDLIKLLQFTSDDGSIESEHPKK